MEKRVRKHVNRGPKGDRVVRLDLNVLVVAAPVRHVDFTNAFVTPLDVVFWEGGEGGAGEEGASWAEVNLL